MIPCRRHGKQFDHSQLKSATKNLRESSCNIITIECKNINVVYNYALSVAYLQVCIKY